jgi:hypothetical protein
MMNEELAARARGGRGASEWQVAGCIPLWQDKAACPNSETSAAG